MAIKNEDAMRDLLKLKNKASQPGSLGNYWNGVFIGSSGAYMVADVITFDQYSSLHREEVPSEATL